MKDSLKFLIGVFVSRLGDSFSFLAFTLILVRQGGSNLNVSLFMVARYLPGVLIGFYFRHHLNGIDPKRWVVGAYLTSAVLLMFAALTIEMPIVLITISFLLGVCYGLYVPLQKTLIPLVFGTSDIRRANANVQLSDVLAKTVGFLIAGLCFTRLGPKFSFAIDAISFVVITVLIAGLNAAEPHQRRENFRSAGIVPVVICPRLKLASMIFALAWVGTGVLFALEASYAKLYLAASEQAIGWLFALATVGALFTPLFLMRAKFSSSLMALGISAAVEMIFVCAYALSNTYISASVFILVYGFFLTLRHILVSSWIHYNVGAIAQPIAFGFQQGLANLAMLVGMGMSGLLTEVLSVRIVILGFAIMSLILILGLIFVNQYRLGNRVLDQHP